MTPFGRWLWLAELGGLLMFYLFLGLGAENMGVFALWEFFQLSITL